MILNLVNRDTALSGEQVYNLLLIPGVLLIFYPSAFAIQSDKDAQMIETLFGIPDYRYKIWLARYLTLYLTAAAVLFFLAAFCRVGLADFSLAKMVLHLMFPLVFLGSLAFFIASLTASGISTAVILVVTILFFWLAAQGLQESSWNLFHNPFASVEQIKTLIWAKTTFLNRMYLALGSVVLTMLALLRLQKREKFI
jgi:hypothetical protein